MSLVVVVLLVAGGYFAYLGLRGSSSSPAAGTHNCVVVRSRLPDREPRPLVLTVKNGTLRNGLAAAVSAQLKQRGFHVRSIGNTVLRIKGVATVRYSANRRQVADFVAAQITGSKLVKAGGHGVVELDLGSRYQSLVSVAKAVADYQRTLPPLSASPTPSESCHSVG